MLSSLLRSTPIKKLLGGAILFGIIFLIFYSAFSSKNISVKVEELLVNNHFSEEKNPENKLSSIDTNQGLNHQPSPDLLLIEVYKNLASSDYQLAQTKVEELIQYFPNFQLAHLIHGDLIAMRTRPTVQFGSAHVNNDTVENKLRDLHQEALARLKAITERPKADLIPSNLLQMSKDQKYALVMDAKRARIYMYENKNGSPTFLGDYYVSQGKLGIDKFREGDQKTPIGVYFITSRLPGTKLPDFYGPGALPINYPNEWDKRNGRGGSGIWLHGVPAGNYSRPPLASDGCIVLSNPDFIHVADMVDKTKTPVIVSEELQFIDRTEWNQEKQATAKLINDWRLDMESKNINQIVSHYSANYKGYANENLQTKMAKQQKLIADIGTIKVKLNDVYQYKYPGKTEMIVSGFTQEITSNRGVSHLKNQQYWIKENQLWKIVYEEQSFISGANLDSIVIAKAEDKKPSVIESNNTRNTNNDKPEKKGSSSDQKMLLSAVDHWASSWSKQNMNAYFAHYAKDFITPDGMSKKAWVDDRRDRIEGKKTITIDIESPSIKVNGNTASVKFRQKYRSGSFNANTRKTLLMIKQDGKWLIKQESTGG
jgi:murein L,D-transpeptidase YafK